MDTPLKHLDRQGSVVVVRVLTAETRLSNDKMPDGRKWSDGIGGKLEVVRALRGARPKLAGYFATNRVGNCSLWEPLRVDHHYILSAKHAGDVYEVTECTSPMHLGSRLDDDPKTSALLSALEEHLRDGKAFDESRLYGLHWPPIPDPPRCPAGTKSDPGSK